MKISGITKIGLTAIAIVILISVLLAVFKMANGNYFANASFINSGLIVIGLIVVVLLIVYGVRQLWTLAIVSLVCVSFGACSYAKSNQQVVVSEDCGMTWKKISVGDAVPRAGMNRCYMKVVMPSYPMQGESKFVSNFSEKVRASIHIDYDYSITEPLSFIRQAKYLGQANADADSKEALNSSAFETAENSVIDKRLREVVKALLSKEDIVEADPATLENTIQEETNRILAPLGVQLNFITLTLDLDEQTRQAIDVATAMKIYQSKGLEDAGREVISARAGATKVTVENKLTPTTGVE